MVSLGALGVVYGDIGTSPLYSVKECFGPEHGLAVDSGNILGVMSLFFWSLTLVVVVKYISIVMRADNRGEGGILALLALLMGSGPGRRGVGLTAVMLALFGAALLYGDGMITPAISVLSAVEGLGVATHAFDNWVVPITVVILTALFWVQRRGTAGVGAVFGPVMLAWFVAIALGGLPWIFTNPSILLAVLPTHAVYFFMAHGWHGLQKEFVLFYLV